MIIGINGYAGSGKDTVGTIIQYLNCPQLQDTPIEDILSDKQKYDHKLEYYSDWEIKKWAGKLKQVASIILGVHFSRFEDQEFKKTNLGPEWNFWTISVISNGKLMFKKGRYSSNEEAEADIPHLVNAYGVFRMEYVVEMQKTSVRDFLQKLGTDGLREGLHTNVWVNALMADYKCVPADRAPGGWDCDNWIITDTRFPNEAKAIKKAGGILIRVERPGVKPVNSHASEVGLDDYDFDYVINNDGSLEDLVNMTREVLSQAGILVHENDPTEN